MGILRKKVFLLILLGLVVLAVTTVVPHSYFTRPVPAPTPTPSQNQVGATQSLNNLAPLASPSATPIPTLSPAEREAKYGPCALVPTLMYHHIQTEDLAIAGHYQNLNVKPDIFQSQMAYLQAHAYHPITMSQLINFFDAGTPLPGKPVLLTFDDGYADFVDNAAPILSSFNFDSTLFVPTGLLENPGYTTWSKLAHLNQNLFYFGNHTWSHKSSAGDLKTETFEITTADTQLNDHHFNSNLVFAYPYGPSSKNDETVLSGLGYKLAFTTVHGFYECKGQRFDLPRIRIGNTSLSTYGL
jgi:hypothetical protein